MGLFRTILNILQDTSRTSPPSVSSIPFADVDDWLDQQQEFLIHSHKLHSERLKLTNSLTTTRLEFLEKVSQWQSRLPAGHEGHLFLDEASSLLEKIPLSPAVELDLLIAFSRNLQSSIQQFLQKLEASPFAQETSFYYYSELRDGSEEAALPVNPLILHFRQLVVEQQRFAETLQQSGYESIASLRRQYQEIGSFQSQIVQLRKRQQLYQVRLEGALRTKDEKEKALQEFRDNPSSQKLVQIEQRRVALRKELEEIEDSLTILFSKLRPALQQYHAVQQHNAAFLSYLEDPVKAFAMDQSLAIQPVLRGLQEALQQGKISIEADQANIIYSAFEQMKSGLLEKWQRQYQTVQQELKDITVPPMNKAFVMKLEEAQYKYDHYARQVEDHQKRLQAIGQEISSLQQQSTEAIHSLQAAIKSALGKSVEISSG